MIDKIESQTAFGAVAVYTLKPMPGDGERYMTVILVSVNGAVVYEATYSAGHNYIEAKKIYDERIQQLKNGTFSW